jgi:hypothetical protein
VWTIQQLSKDSLPSLGSVLFGAFQVIEVTIGNDDSKDGTQTELASETYVDIGFGSDRSRFSGFHRFSVVREPPAVGAHDSIYGIDMGARGSSNRVRITFSSLACDPSRDKPAGWMILSAFHKQYAMLLLREGVAEVLRE